MLLHETKVLIEFGVDSKEVCTDTVCTVCNIFCILSQGKGIISIPKE